MFRLLVPLFPPAPAVGTEPIFERRVRTLFRTHPSELALLLETAWESGRFDRISTESLGHPDHRSDLDGITRVAVGSPAGAAAFFIRQFVRWHHLIYAYTIENTRVYEIFRRVVHEYLHGEQLGVPIPGSEHWLRNTEELFYKDPAPFLITSVASHIRPDLGGTRRNAYQRMFGWDLGHGLDDKKEYPYTKAKASNTDFEATFEDLLREVWVGITNVNTISGANPTDDAAIANLTERLHNMLISRRETGNLSREEFYAVSTLSWFHLTLEFDSPIVVALRAEAASPEERLFKIAERVRLPAHGKSRNLFEIAEPFSILLTLIETGALNTTASARALYDATIPLNPPPPQPLPDLMRTIINQWSNVTGRDMKTRKTQVTA